jgi:hypothetical protein
LIRRSNIPNRQVATYPEPKAKAALSKISRLIAVISYANQPQQSLVETNARRVAAVPQFGLLGSSNFRVHLASNRAAHPWVADRGDRKHQDQPRKRENQFTAPTDFACFKCESAKSTRRA